MKVDANGLICPEPIMMLHKAINDSIDGAIIELEATDPTAERDVKKFCHFLGHELLDFKQNGDQLIFKIKKKIDNLEFKNSLLSDNLDLDYVETLIREKFLFGKEGETIYIIKNNDN